MDLNHRLARQKRLKRQKCDTADIIFGQKSGPLLAGRAGPATTASCKGLSTELIGLLIRTVDMQPFFHECMVINMLIRQQCTKWDYPLDKAIQLSRGDDQKMIDSVTRDR